jgi:hypothetical protein
LPLGE